MITEQQRQWAENVIACLRAKLEGKTIQWKTDCGWFNRADETWTFDPQYTYRIAPEPPQEKMKRWAFVGTNGLPYLGFGSLAEARAYARDNGNYDAIVEMTETARIEPEPPKKREPRRIWVNRYSKEIKCGNWGRAYSNQQSAITNKDYDAAETAVEFVEVIK